MAGLFRAEWKLAHGPRDSRASFQAGRASAFLAWHCDACPSLVDVFARTQMRIISCLDMAPLHTFVPEKFSSVCMTLDGRVTML